MLTLPSELATHLAGDVTSITVCWAVTRNNGEVLRGTAHDSDIAVDSGPLAGTYKARTAVFATDIQSKSDGSVSNLDVEGAFRVDAIAGDMTVEEIEGGLFDQATAVLFLVNWRNPSDGVRILLAGTLGEFYRDSDGRYRSEVRGITQALSQQIVRTYSSTCNVTRFGDDRCKFNTVPATRTATVTAVTDRRRFAADLDAGTEPPTPVYFFGSRLKFTSGSNEDVVREVRVCIVDTGDDSAELLLWDEEPADIQIGDTFELPPACDFQYETCRLVHDNLVNFRGYGIYAVGRDALMRGPNDTVSEPLAVLTFEEYEEQLQAKADAGVALL